MPPAPHLLLTGSTGLVGRALTSTLSATNQITPLLRLPPTPNLATWDPLTRRIDLPRAAAFDAVIHLSGENLAQGRWTPAKKARIVSSRVDSTLFLSQTLGQLTPKPRLFLCASAIGFYGDRGLEPLTEDSSPGSGFLADTCRQWEQSTSAAVSAGIRTLHLRFGVILSASGGALAKMLIPFRLGLGGPIGNGHQYLSWITLDDVVATIAHLINSSSLTGPVNIVAPNPVTNRDFAQSLARALHRPAILPLPAFAARLLFGQMADELLLASTRVLPHRLSADGFIFQHPNLDTALQQIFNPSPANR